VNNDSQWYFVVDEQGDRRQEGPVSGAELATMVSDGTLAPDTLVWRDGMADWEQIGALAEFQLPASQEPPAPEGEPEPAAAPESDIATAGEAASDTEAAFDGETALDDEAALESEPEAAPAAEMPSDEALLREFENYSVHLSKSGSVLLVRTNDYHAGPLALTKLDLLGFLTAMETAAQRLEPDASAGGAGEIDQEG
jgi:hypothetical protein